MAITIDNMLKNIKDILSDRGLTISVAESCTGGNLQSLLTSVSGSSKYFNGGITAYNIDAKCKYLEVDFETAHDCDCVSQEVAEQMARGVVGMFESNIGISTTGYIEKYLHYCIVRKNEWDQPPEILISERIELDGNSIRSDVQNRACLKILKVLLNYLNTEYSPDSII